MVNNLITIILLIIAFYSKGKMDKSSDGKFEDKYKNKDKSWGNKYFSPLNRYQKKWYYFGFVKPAYKERFPFSSTLFVFTTDYWHRMQFLFLNSWMVALSINIGSNYIYSIISFIIIRLVYLLAFNISYEKK